MSDQVTNRSGASLPLSHTFGYQLLAQKKDYDYDATVPADATWTPFESNDKYGNADVDIYLTFYQIGAKVFFTVTKQPTEDERSLPLSVTWTRNGGVGFTDDRGAIINWLQLISKTQATVTKSLIFLVCDNFDGFFVLIPCNMNDAHQCGSFAVRKKVAKPLAVLARLMNIVPSTKGESNLYIQNMLKALRLRSDNTTELIPSDDGARVMAPYLTDEDTESILRGALLGLEPGNKVIRWCNLLTGYDLDQTTANFYLDTLTIASEMWKTQGVPILTNSLFAPEYDGLVPHLPELAKDLTLYQEWVHEAMETDHNGALVRAGKYGIDQGLFTLDDPFIPAWLRELLVA
ncbi:VP9 [Eriocheir sinensis reovirus]|uniref:VP9 n=1 Tax=Eriocheir sinensis reovirus TaxID=273810 RepID=A0A0E3X8X2_ESRV|nr:VP9 [Eriocheir sinensis reovirus]AKC01928.1 VP9 [Eriocheir sinensis reovirus]